MMMDQMRIEMNTRVMGGEFVVLFFFVVAEEVVVMTSSHEWRPPVRADWPGQETIC